MLYPAPAGGNGGNTDVGITATSIQLGMIQSASGVLPGATSGSARGANAYFNYINANGGVFGRKLALNVQDDGFDITKAQAACDRLIPASFALVANYGVGDTGCYSAVKSSGIPWVGMYFLPFFFSLPNVFNPGFGNPLSETDGGWLFRKSQHPTDIKLAMITPKINGIQPFVDAQIKVVKAAGYDVVDSQSLDTASPSFASAVIEMRSKGVNAIDAFADDITTVSRLAQAMAQQGFDPPVKVTTGGYDAKWQTLAGAGAVGWEAQLQTPPYLDHTELQATPGGQLFLKWTAKTDPGTAIDVFTTEGWNSAAYFVKALVAAGAKPTRANVIAALTAIKSFNNDGMLGESNPGDKLVTKCIVLVKATATGFVRIHPTQKGTYACTGDVIL